MSDTTAASNQDINNTRFNKEASTWDKNQKHVESCQQAFEAIRRYVPAFADGSSKHLDVLEIGCGTGLLSFLLIPHIRSLIGVDTSTGMLDAFNTKIASLPDLSKANLAAVNVLIHDPDDTHIQGAAAALASRRGESGHDVPYRFDLVVSHLTLHHIASLPDIITTMWKCLRPGGIVALTDFEDFGPEAIKFHAKSKREGVQRHGVKKAEIEEVLEGTGFNEVRVERAWVARKEIEEEGEGKEMEFPFLICVGRRG